MKGFVAYYQEEDGPAVIEFDSFALTEEEVWMKIRNEITDQSGYAEKPKCDQELSDFYGDVWNVVPCEIGGLPEHVLREEPKPIDEDPVDVPCEENHLPRVKKRKA